MGQAVFGCGMAKTLKGNLSVSKTTEKSIAVGFAGSTGGKSMRVIKNPLNSHTISNTCRLLNVGVVAPSSLCLSMLKTLRAIRPSRLRVVAVALYQECAPCRAYAGELEIEVFEDYGDLLTVECLDLIMDLTGDEAILADIILRKRPSVSVLDAHSSMLMLEMVKHEAEILETPLTSTLLEASPDGILVIDREYRIVNCNESLLIPGSTDREAIIGRYCHEVMQQSTSPCRGRATDCPAHEILRTGKLARTVYEIPGPDDTVLIRQGTAYPVFNQMGEVTQFVLAIRDMTNDVSKKVEERTQALKKDLARVVQEDRLASLGRLVASVCHEINNPITSIVTFTKLVRAMIQKGNLSEKEKATLERYLDLSFKEGMRCGSIVKDLLTFARPRSAEAKQVDLAEVVGTILLLTGHQLELSNICSVSDLPRGSFAAWGDSAQIQQCLLNLIFNAIDAMPGGGTLTISGGVDEACDLVWLAVSDTGHGIDPADMPRIFEPFYSTKTDAKGVGLGLSMVYGIIREHHGTVEVESELGKGSTFTLKLPTKAAAGRRPESAPDVVFAESALEGL